MKNIEDIFNVLNIEEKVDKEEKRNTILKNAWKSVAGEACFAHTDTVATRNGILYITMDSQVWQQELMLQQTSELATAMTDASGITIVKLRITAGGQRRI